MTLAFQAPMENLWNYNPFKTFPIWPRNLQPRTVSYTWALLSRELRIKLLPLLIEWPFPNIWKLRLNHILMSPLLLRHMNPVLNVSHYLLSWQEKNRTMCRHSDCQKLRHKIGDCNSHWPTAVFFSESGDIRLHFDYTFLQGAKSFFILLFYLCSASVVLNISPPLVLLAQHHQQQQLCGILFTAMVAFISASKNTFCESQFHQLDLLERPFFRSFVIQRIHHDCWFRCSESLTAKSDM